MIPVSGSETETPRLKYQDIKITEPCHISMLVQSSHYNQCPVRLPQWEHY